MVREAILQKIEDKGMSQAKLCERLGITKQNFSSFLTGRRSLPFQTVIEVFRYLGLSVGPISKGYASQDASHISQILSNRLNHLDLSLKDFSNLCGVHQSTISSFFSGKRNISTKNLERIVNALRFSILPYKAS